MNVITVHEVNPEPWRERVAARLPAKAQRKLERWRQDAADAATLRLADSETLIQLRAEKGAAQRELDELLKADERGMLVVERRVLDEKSATGFRTEQQRDEARLSAARRRVQTAQDQIERLTARLGSLTNNPLGVCEAYLRQLPPHTDLTEHEGPPAARLPDETFPDAIERVRNAIDSLKQEARAVALAPIPAQEAIAAARKELAMLAERGRPGVLALLERAGKIRWPVQPLTGVQLVGGEIPQLPDTLALLAFLFPEQMTTAISRLVAESADDEFALTDEARRARTQQIAAEILELERQEEDLIEQAEASGIVVSRRADCDPRAVLSLSSSLPPMRRP